MNEINVKETIVATTAMLGKNAAWKTETLNFNSKMSFVSSGSEG